MVLEALEEAGGHRLLAAEQLEVSSRTLYRLIVDLGLGDEINRRWPRMRPQPLRHTMTEMSR